MATGMIPIPITDAALTAHSVAEPSPGEVAWTSGATFNLGDRCILGTPSGTVTITNASPAVVTWTANGLPNGTPVRLTTTGSLPTGLTVGTTYYVVNRTTNTVQLSTEVGGTPVATSSAGSGTHTATASVHTVYESLKDSNTGKPPAIDDGTNWFVVGPTNLTAMLDLYRPSITWGTSPMTFTLTPGQVIRSLFFGNLFATQIDIVQKRAGVPIKSWSRELYTREVTSFTDYWYKPFTVQQEVQISDLLLYADCTIEVTITRATGMAGIGEVVMGNPVYLGKTQYGAQRKNRNFTKFDRNSDGTPKPPTRQRNVPTSAQTIWFEKASTRALMQFLEDANGRIVVVSGLDDDTDPYFAPVLILGLITTGDIDLTYPDHGVLSLVAEEY